MERARDKPNAPQVCPLEGVSEGEAQPLPVINDMNEEILTARWIKVTAKFFLICYLVGSEH